MTLITPATRRELQEIVGLKRSNEIAVERAEKALMEEQNEAVMYAQKNLSDLCEEICSDKTLREGVSEIVQMYRGYGYILLFNDSKTLPMALGIWGFKDKIKHIPSYYFNESFEEIPSNGFASILNKGCRESFLRATPEEVSRRFEWCITNRNPIYKE
jgi:hypothetical protein